jgi:hypothetical protein
VNRDAEARRTTTPDKPWVKPPSGLPQPPAPLDERRSAVRSGVPLQPDLPAVPLLRRETAGRNEHAAHRTVRVPHQLELIRPRGAAGQNLYARTVRVYSRCAGHGGVAARR